jgi:spermidine dehydrogenase
MANGKSRDPWNPDSKITRKDFLDGVAITAAGLAAASALPGLTGAEAAFAASSAADPDFYPPTATGLKGQPDGPLGQFMAIDGKPNQKDVHSTRGGTGIKPNRIQDTGEVYDCVVVGAGASGLAAAKFYQDRFGPDAKILILDPLADFGGHSHRNEFHIPYQGNDLMILRNGGTVNLDSIGTWNQPASGLFDIPGSYGQPAVDLLGFCGVDYNNFPSSQQAGIPGSFGLRAMLLFPSEDWGTDTVIQNRLGTQPWPDFLALTPFSPEAQAGIARIQTDTTTDWITLKHGPTSDADKKQLLARMTQKQYYMDYVGVPEESTIWYQRNGHGLLGAGVQAISAADAWALGQAGFGGLGLLEESFPGIGRTPQLDFIPNGGPSRAWPDGNISLLRLLVAKLIPAAIPDVDGGRPNQENIVKATTDYSKLDLPANSIRIRLNSMVFRVKPAKDWRDNAIVEYVVGGKGKRVVGKHVVMACWNRVTAKIVDGLPTEQVENLCYARKVPLIYARAVLNNWQAFADARVSSVTPRGNSLFWDSTSLAAGARFGNAYGPTPNQPPTAPAVLSFQVVPSDHNATPQLAAYEGGRKRLLELSFQELEGAVWDVLDRSVNKLGGDFDPERDVHAVMVNRWNYGYAHELTSTWDPSAFGPVADQPQVKGRVPFKNVSIANSDSGAMAYTHSAIAEGYRAIQDLPA